MFLDSNNQLSVEQQIGNPEIQPVSIDNEQHLYAMTTDDFHIANTTLANSCGDKRTPKRRRLYNKDEEEDSTTTLSKVTNDKSEMSVNQQLLRNFNYSHESKNGIQYETIDSAIDVMLSNPKLVILASDEALSVATQPVLIQQIDHNNSAENNEQIIHKLPNAQPLLCFETTANCHKDVGSIPNFVNNQDIANEDISNEDIVNENISKEDIANQDISSEDIANKNIENETSFWLPATLEGKTLLIKNSAKLTFVMLRIYSTKFMFVYFQVLQCLLESHSQHLLQPTVCKMTKFLNKTYKQY